MSTSIIISIPKSQHGKVIGSHARTKLDIESDYGVTLIFPKKEENSDEITIQGPNKSSVEYAKTRILDIVGLNPDTQLVENERRKVETARVEKDELFRQANAAPKGSRERDDLFKQANQAKDRLEQIENATARVIFNTKNKGYGMDQMDLHGLRVEDALEFVNERLNTIETLPPGQFKQLTIIVGAGHHSEGGIAKIKPAVTDLLVKRHFFFENDPNNEGQILVFTPQSKEAPAVPDLWQSFLSFVDELMCCFTGRTSSSMSKS
jgi:hypothetical protein